MTFYKTSRSFPQEFLMHAVLIEIIANSLEASFTFYLACPPHLLFDTWVSE